MSGATIGWTILGVIVAAIVIVVVFYILSWLYRRSTKEVSFVRTGFGGQKVVINGGALVLPVIHDVIPVNMNTLRLEVRRGRESALITKNRMRVDVVAEFYVRVKATPEAVADAAQTLGSRTMQPDQLRELLEGKFVDALRAVAAEMTMEEMHEKRGEYMKRVRAAVADDLLQERAGARVGLAHQPRPDQHGVLQPLQRVRRRGPHAAHRGDRAPQEDPQRHRAGHDDPDPQQEPRVREARARHRPRQRVRAPRPGARARGAPRRAARGARSRARPARPRVRAGADRGDARGGAREDRRRSGRSRSSASRASARSRGSRSSGARRSSSPSRPAPSRSPRSRARSRRRRPRPTSRAPRRWPRRRRCSPRASWRSRGAARRSS